MRQSLAVDDRHRVGRHQNLPPERYEAEICPRHQRQLALDYAAHVEGHDSFASYRKRRREVKNGWVQWLRPCATLGQMFARYQRTVHSRKRKTTTEILLCSDSAKDRTRKKSKLPIIFTLAISVTVTITLVRDPSRRTTVVPNVSVSFSKSSGAPDSPTRRTANSQATTEKPSLSFDKEFDTPNPVLEALRRQPPPLGTMPPSNTGQTPEPDLSGIVSGFGTYLYERSATNDLISVSVGRAGTAQ